MLEGGLENGPVDSVLGLSITSNAVGLVLVEGENADGEIVDRDAIEVPADGTATSTRAADQIAAAVSRTKQIDGDYRLHAIGLTWSDDAGTEASLLLEALAKNGFDSVVPVRLPQASEAFAQGIGVVLGYTRTAVCVVEPDGAIASMVDSTTDEMRASACDDVDRESLFAWLCDLMAPQAWQPEAVVLVGTGLVERGLDLVALGEDLEAALDVPVFAPAEAELALARGAALASVRGADVGIADLDEYIWESPGVGPRQRRPRRVVVGMAALAAGAVTFVVSLAVAAGMQLTPDRAVQETANRTVADSAQAAIPEAAAPEAIPSLPVVPEVVPEPAPEAAIAPEVLPEPAPVDIPEPVYLPEDPVVAAPEPVYAPEVPVLAPAPVVVAQPPAVVPQVPPVETERPGFFGRLRERIQAIGDDPEPAQVVPAPVPAVPPPGVIPIPGQP